MKTVAASGNGRVEISILDVPYGRRYYIGSGVLEEYATSIPAFKMPSDDDTVDYDLVISGSKFKTRKSTKTYRHFVKLSGTDGTYEGELYITITSTNGNTINNLTDFDTVMTNFTGTVECSGYYTENLNDGYPIIRLMWEGTSATSKFSYLREGALVEAALSKLTTVDDRVVQA